MQFQSHGKSCSLKTILHFVCASVCQAIICVWSHPSQCEKCKQTLENDSTNNYTMKWCLLLMTFQYCILSTNIACRLPPPLRNVGRGRKGVRLRNCICAGPASLAVKMLVNCSRSSHSWRHWLSSRPLWLRWYSSLMAYLTSAVNCGLGCWSLEAVRLQLAVEATA